MQISLSPLFRTTAAGPARPHVRLAQHIRQWLLTSWQARCEQAERPNRKVPRY